VKPQPFRAATGGAIDRTRALGFTFNGRRYEGHPGDTLASALVANGVRLVGRSFKYHRPRGIVAAGVEEPNALVQLEGGARTEPNTRATQIELFDGLVATSQNCWPSVEHDLGAIAGLFAPLLPAGFYYKTFLKPESGWLTYERFIRKAAGLGRAPRLPDPDHYEHRHARVDVLVVGGGPAGLAAASVAARAGARVLLADENPALGGRLRAERATIDGAAALDWVAATAGALAERAGVTVLNRATAFGLYDQNLVGIVEHVADSETAAAAHLPRQRLWLVRARQVVLAAGALERPLAFADNDRPGVMLAASAQAYVNQFGALPGRRAVVFTNNDGAYVAARDLHRAGIEIAAVVDARARPADAVSRLAIDGGIACLGGRAIVRVSGRHAVAGVEVMRLADGGTLLRGSSAHIDCDLVLMSGGWAPTVHLFSQLRGRLAYDARLGAVVPADGLPAVRCAGAGAGRLALADALADGLAAGAAAAAAAGFGDGQAPPTPPIEAAGEAAPHPLWVMPVPRGRRAKRFVDFQNDVTAADVALAVREGYRSIEHVKRYTTLGMGTDQGKTGNLNGLVVAAAALGADPGTVGTTTFRPPYAPVTFGALAGHHVGGALDPLRVTPMDGWHADAGAKFINAGLWRRPQLYPRAGESELDTVNREALNVRRAVGVVDVSTLGKIDIQGRDAAEFLNRVYVNGWKTLAVGRCRYGVMLREDGFVFDDGTTSRLDEQRYFMTTTTANAGRVLMQLEQLAQVVWPELDVKLTAVTDHWAALALAGPRARDVLAALKPDFPVDDAALPYMAWREGRLAGVPARVFRISFSGERAYEIYAPADHGTALWQAVVDAGTPHGLMVYGTEAMGVLRIEKGHFVPGPEADGRTTLDDLGLGRLMSRAKDCVGKGAAQRPALTAAGRKQLVGLVASDPTAAIPAGAQLVLDPARLSPNPMVGHVCSMCYSPTLERWIALALVRAGRDRLGETLTAMAPLVGRRVEVTIVPHVFVDPEGTRVHG
jgi:sarcosine oxidase subunit alpha